MEDGRLKGLGMVGGLNAGKSWIAESVLRARIIGLDIGKGQDRTAVCLYTDRGFWVLLIPAGTELLKNRPDELRLRFPNGILVTYRPRRKNPNG